MDRGKGPYSAREPTWPLGGKLARGGKTLSCKLDSNSALFSDKTLFLLDR